MKKDKVLTKRSLGYYQDLAERCQTTIKVLEQDLKLERLAKLALQKKINTLRSTIRQLRRRIKS